MHEANWWQLQAGESSLNRSTLNLNTMKIKILLAAVSLLTVGLANSAMALTISSPEYVGNIDPNTPSNPENEVEYINALAGLAPGGSTDVDGSTVTRDGNWLGDLPTVTLVGAAKDDSDPSTSVDVTGFAYLLGKYGTTSIVFYVGELTGVQTIPGDFGLEGENENGLSHWSLYGSSTTVPDGGTTAVLLGLGLVAVSFIARRRILS
jgi:hypothetical protein